MVSEILIHTSDLSSPTKPWEISVKWSKRVNLEFMLQNKLEEMRDEIPITAFFKDL